MAARLGGRVCARRGRVSGAIVSLLTLAFAAATAQAQTPDALPFSKGFLLSGGYAVGSVDLNPKSAAGGFVNGTIPMSGIPADAEIVGAYVYWEMITTDVAQIDGAKFRGLPITVVKASPLALTPANAPCWCGLRGPALRIQSKQRDLHECVLPV